MLFTAGVRCASLFPVIWLVVAEVFCVFVVFGVWFSFDFWCLMHCVNMFRDLGW